MELCQSSFYTFIHMSDTQLEHEVVNELLFGEKKHKI